MLPCALTMKRSSMIVAGIAALLLLALIGGAAWFLLFNVNTLVANLIVQEGSRAIGSQVTVDGVSIDLKEGSAGIRRFAVANPEGFSRRAAIALDDLRIELEPRAVAADPLVIDRIVVGGARLLVEQAGANNNLRTILGSLRRSADDGPAETGDRKVVVEQFELERATTTLFLPELEEERSVDMPGIVLTGVGRAENGAAAASLARQLLAPLIRAGLESMAARGAADAPEDSLDELRHHGAGELLRRQDSRDAGESGRDVP